MKTIIFLFSILLTVAVMAQKNIHIGISESDLQSEFSNLEKSTYENSATYTRPDTLYGLDSKWGYRFEKNSLNWIYFMRYDSELNEANFNKHLEACEKLIKDYSKIYGTPDSLINGEKVFKDPYTEHHWGYDVLEARWYDADGMKIKIRFTFMGGKGEYNFLLTIDIFDKSYSYF
jgi:hypothetical protein